MEYTKHDLEVDQAREWWTEFINSEFDQYTEDDKKTVALRIVEYAMTKREFASYVLDYLEDFQREDFFVYDPAEHEYQGNIL